MDVGVRLVTEEDAAPLAALLQSNRDFLTPWEPARDDDYFTPNHQLRLITEQLATHRDGVIVPLVIVNGGQVVGRVTVNHVIRGVFLSAHLGYWVSQRSNGKGVATAAVAAAVRVAFDQLELHRLQAGTLQHNVASQRVLLRNGFVRIGLAPGYLRIAGRWQDHVLYQLLNQNLD